MTSRVGAWPPVIDWPVCVITVFVSAGEKARISTSRLKSRKSKPVPAVNRLVICTVGILGN